MDPTAFSAVFTGAFNEVRQSDRNFVRGYFLPAGIFSALCVHVFSLFDLLSAAVNLWLGVGVAVSLTALLAVILFVLNPSLVRAKEGYGLFNQPWNPFKLWEERRFRKIEVELQELLERRSSENEVPPEVLNRLTALAFLRHDLGPPRLPRTTGSSPLRVSPGPTPRAMWGRMVKTSVGSFKVMVVMRLGFRTRCCWRRPRTDR